MTPRDYISTVMPTLEGWCWPEKALAMVELIKRLRPSVVVEIGVFGGRSLIPQALALQQTNNGIIYGIDPWSTQDALEGGLEAITGNQPDPNQQAHQEWWAKVDLLDIMKKALLAIRDARVEPHCAILATDSVKAAPFFSLLPIDILHIDGNHSERISCRDVSLYLPKMRSGGYIWFDDAHWPTTARAQQLLLEGGCRKVSDLAYTDGTMAVSLYQTA